MRHQYLHRLADLREPLLRRRCAGVLSGAQQYFVSERLPLRLQDRDLRARRRELLPVRRLQAPATLLQRHRARWLLSRAERARMPDDVRVSVSTPNRRGRRRRYDFSRDPDTPGAAGELVLDAAGESGIRRARSCVGVKRASRLDA